MMEELEHSKFLSDKVIDKIAKLFTLSFPELNYVETILSIWRDWNNAKEYLCFSLKIGDIWIHTWLESEGFIGTDFGTGYDLIKEKVVNTFKNDLTFKSFVKLEKINEDFK